MTVIHGAPAAAAAAAQTQQQEPDIPECLKDVFETWTPLERRTFEAIQRRLKELCARGERVIRLELLNTPRAALGAVAAALKHTKLVQELQVSAAEFPQLPEVLAENPCMTSLVASNLACENAPACMAAVVRSENIRCFGLQNFQERPETVAEVGKAVEVFAKSYADPNCVGLEKFALGNKELPLLEPDHIASMHQINILPLMRALEGPSLSMMTLTGLSLAGLVVEDPVPTSEALAAALRSPECRLRHVELFSGHDPTSIAVAVSYNSTLAYLQWDSTDLKPLADALVVNETLTVLDLLRCVHSTGALDIAQKLCANRGLRTLRLPLEIATDEVYVALADSLRVNRSLRNFTVRSMCGGTRTLTLKTLTQVGEKLREAAGIERFGISSNWVSPEHTTEFTSASGNVFYFDPNGSDVFRRIRELSHIIFTVKWKTRQEHFKVPCEFTMSTLLNWVAERFGCSVDGLRLLSDENRKPIFGTSDPLAKARQQVGDRFLGRSHVSMLLTRGNTGCAIVHAWQKLQPPSSETDTQESLDTNTKKRKAESSSSSSSGQPELKYQRTDFCCDTPEPFPSMFPDDPDSLELIAEVLSQAVPSSPEECASSASVQEFLCEASASAQEPLSASFSASKEEEPGQIDPSRRAPKPVFENLPLDAVKLICQMAFSPGLRNLPPPQFREQNPAWTSDRSAQSEP